MFILLTYITYSGTIVIVSILIKVPDKGDPKAAGRRYSKSDKGRAAIARAVRIYGLRKVGMPESEIYRVKEAIQILQNIPEDSRICPIFKKPMHEIGNYAADHCHKTLKFRGIISQRANAILGLAYDDPSILRRLADYVENSGLDKVTGFEYDSNHEA